MKRTTWLALLLLGCTREAPAAPPPPAPRVPVVTPDAAAVAEPTREIAAPVAAQGAAPASSAAVRERYLGKHELGVNRVSAKRRCGSVTVVEREGALVLAGEGREGAFELQLSGTIEHVSDSEFVLDGVLRGTPDMRWRDEPLRERETRGKFLFRATKGRKFWRLYEVDGRACVCQDGCGNDFCYIDIDIAQSE